MINHTHSGNYALHYTFSTSLKKNTYPQSVSYHSVCDFYAFEVYCSVLTDETCDVFTSFLCYHQNRKLFEGMIELLYHLKCFN